MTKTIDELLAERDAEWREAFAPGNSDTYLGKTLTGPNEARLYRQAGFEVHYEDVIYFEKRATKARLRRREAEHNLLVVAKAWDQSCNSGSDPNFPTHVAAMLRAALAKGKKAEPTAS